jgi:hypothetical protein
MQWDPKLEKEVQLSILAEVSGVWATSDLDALLSLGDMHIWSQQYVEKRRSWRAQQPLTIVELRCSRLRAPLVLPNTDALWGCFSFAELEGVTTNDVGSAEAILSDPVFSERQTALRDRLARFGIKDVSSQSSSRETSRW